MERASAHKLIHIHLTVSSNSVAYAKYVINNYIGLASRKQDLSFHAYCLDGRSAKKMLADPQVERVVTIEKDGGSMGHAKAIEAAIGNFHSGCVNVISDTDVCILRQSWDSVLLEELCGANGVGVFATQYEGIGGFSSGNVQRQQYKNKPSATWMAVSPNCDLSKLSVLPDKGTNIYIENSYLSKLYQLPMGYYLEKDVGWQVPAYLEENGVSYRVLDLVKPSEENAIALRGCGDYHDEFQWGGEPFLAHQRGSMKHRFKIDRLSAGFYNACERHMGDCEWFIEPDRSDRLAACFQDVFRNLIWPLKWVKRQILRK